MAEPVLSWRSSDGATVAPDLDLAIVAGVPSDPAARRQLHNDYGGAAGSETATEVAVSVMTCEQGTDAFSFDDDAAAFGWIEARTVVGAVVGPWRSIGRNRWLLVPDIPAEGHAIVEFRGNAPAGASTTARDVLLVTRCREMSEPLADGLGDVAARGIVLGIGDPSSSFLLEGGQIVPADPPDDTLSALPRSGLVAGVPFSLGSSTPETLNQDDVDSVALTSGKVYVAGITQAADGSITVTKGASVSAPGGPDDRPVLPDEPFLGWVTVRYQSGGTSEILESDIDTSDVSRSGFWLQTSTSSLVGELGPGLGFFGGRRVRVNSRRSVSFSASASNTVWITPGAAIVVTTSPAAPMAGAAPLWRATTDVAGVTAVQDLRPFLEPSVAIGVHLSVASPTWQNPFPQALWIRPVGTGCRMFLWDVPSSLGASSGAWVGDVEVMDEAGIWSSIFPAPGSEDLRPAIAFDSSSREASRSWPSTLRIEANQLVRFVMADDPPDGTPASGASLVLNLEVPR